MAVISMTGFARREGGLNADRWAIELRSVNGRSLDLKMRMPQGLEGLEGEIRTRVAASCRRGSIQLSINLQSSDKGFEIALNAALLSRLMAQGDALARERGETPPPLSAYLGLKGVVETAAEPMVDEDARKARDGALLADFDEALAGFAAMRASEGEALRQVLNAQLDEMDRLRLEAESRPERSIEAIEARLAEQVSALTKASPALDPARLHQEAALLATKADIREELDRLEGHVVAARALFADEAAIGRKLDFLAQEMNREANTLCSKSSSREITAIGLALKALIDQFKEQVQNIE